MGALHEGHLSLVRRACQENEVVVVSIFVNPTQFNNPADLRNYPRTLNADAELLASEGVTYLFVPSVQEMYPEPDMRTFRFSPLDEVMEGPSRPGHFNGVAQVVSKLFHIVEPDRAYFGEKDFQQLAIIRVLTEQLNLPIQIVGCPICRAKDGLALSSRNALLTPKQRIQALAISATLFHSHQLRKQGHSLSAVKQYVEQAIADAHGLELEYFCIANAHTLQPLSHWPTDVVAAEAPVGCIVVYCGTVRLIDNIRYDD
jgi:pantoate--beta-alanine ligase